MLQVLLVLLQRFQVQICNIVVNVSVVDAVVGVAHVVIVVVVDGSWIRLPREEWERILLQKVVCIWAVVVVVMDVAIVGIDNRRVVVGNVDIGAIYNGNVVVVVELLNRVATIVESDRVVRKKRKKVDVGGVFVDVVGVGGWQLEVAERMA